MSSETPTSRRRVLAAGGLGVGAAALSACGSGEYQGSRLTETATTPAPEQTEQGAVLVAASEVPVGQAISTKGPDGKPVIVAQPSEGEFTAHSAICTHLGCTVKPAGKLLRCPCHGSAFKPATGKVVDGPADRPLPDIPVHVQDGKVVTGSQ